MASDPQSIDAYVDTVVKATTSELQTPSPAAGISGKVDPCSIVIFGATGDLVHRKLAPALFNLYLHGAFPESFAILGAARSEITRDQFRDRMKQALAGIDDAKLDAFTGHLYYQNLDLESAESFQQLSRTLKALDSKHNTMANNLFYLAIPPSAYKSVAAMLGQAGLSGEQENGRGWSRIVVEKPFGQDLKSAKELNRALHSYFREDQIFRIDHYLAKETVQNVLMFRFANAIFEPIWNRMYIDHIHINAVESLGIEKRASYYEEAGILRDMFQNHMMQLLAVTAMEPPSLFEANQVRDEHVKVFRALRPFSSANQTENLVMGQYGPGTVDGKPVRGYREEPGVRSDSLTPTFGMMTVHIDNWRWQDVPFYLTSGKRLAKKLTEIVIHFKSVPHSLFQGVLGESINPNLLTLGIQPDEKINLTFQTKMPGARVSLRSVAMDFNYLENYSGPIFDEYEKALLDCMQGDQMLFWREDAVELCWAFVDPILEDCETCADRGKRLLSYESGSWGPDAAKIGRD
jgi:glucose-6-phosphate 1-dehydrogenase